MQSMNREVKKNSGFTLIEVLVAIIILAIMSVPFARAFATAAQTNRRARIEAKCNNAAENIAESFRNTKVEELIKTFTGKDVEDCTVDGNGNNVWTDGDGNTVKFDPTKEIYTFDIVTNDLLPEGIPDNYFARVTLDPRYYENANALNVAHVEPVSQLDSAVYVMPSGFDDDVYQEYLNRNDLAVANGNTGNFDKLDDGFNFRDHVKRIITLTINHDPAETYTDNSKTSSGEEAEVIDLVKVSLTVTYELLPDGKTYFATDSERKQIINIGEIYTNHKNKNKFRGAYLFFYPTYMAGQNDKTNDSIYVINKGDVECNVNIVAMVEGVNDLQFKTIYDTLHAPYIKVVESKDLTDKEAKITLRTNMNTYVPYSEQSENNGTYTYSVEYYRATRDTTMNDEALVAPAGSGIADKNVEDSAKSLHLQDVDGKALYKEENPKRIYKMFIEILGDEKTITTESGDVTVNDLMVEFDGTKLEF